MEGTKETYYVIDTKGNEDTEYDVGMSMEETDNGVDITVGVSNSDNGFAYTNEISITEEEESN